MTLGEYGNLTGFLHISEISTGWVKSIERFVRVGQKTVLKVIRIGKARKEIDLSLRQVTGEEKKEKLLQVKRTEKASVVLEQVKNQLDLQPEEVEKYRELLESKFDDLYESLDKLLRRGQSIFTGLELPQPFVEALEKTAKEKIVLPIVELGGVLELTSTDPEGVEIIKKTLTSVGDSEFDGAKVRLTYLGAPRYKLAVTAEDYKMAERVLNSSLKKIRDLLGKKSTFNFIREEGRKKVAQ